MFEPGFTCEFGCNPGDAISLNATWSGLDLFGRATLDGLSWDHIGGDDASALVQFRAASHVPLSSADLVSVTVPFDFAGLFFHNFEGADVRETLVGRGDVTITFERPLHPNQGTFEIRRTVYTFSPVPEPGTLLLVATGIAASAGRGLTRRRPRDGRRTWSMRTRRVRVPTFR